MKTFHQYLAESERTYDYRIKILGDVPQEFIKNLEEKMAQFDIVKLSRPKTTPVQKLQKDFPGAENESVTFMDVSFRYPAIEPQIKQLAQLLGLNPNFITLQTAAYDDSIAKEIADITNVSINTALGRMRYALNNLRKMFETKEMSIKLI